MKKVLSIIGLLLIVTLVNSTDIKYLGLLEE